MFTLHIFFKQRRREWGREGGPLSLRRGCQPGTTLHKYLADGAAKTHSVMIIQGWMGARKAWAGQVLAVVQQWAVSPSMEEWCLFSIFVILGPLPGTGCPGISIAQWVGQSMRQLTHTLVLHSPDSHWPSTLFPTLFQRPVVQQMTKQRATE